MFFENAIELLNNVAALGKGDPDPGYFTMGVIIRATPGSYDYLVRTSDKPAIVCRCLEEQLDKVFGTRAMSVLTEQTPVIVYVESVDSRYGFIVGVVPTVFYGKPTADSPAPFGFSLNPESGASFWSEEAYSEPQLDSKNVSRVIANAGRPADVLPGDWGKINDFGAMLALLGPMAILKATDLAKIEAYVLDDMIRVVSGQFQHFTSMGEYHIYNDGGRTTTEFAGSPHQLEVMGIDEYSTAEDGIYTVVEPEDRTDAYDQSDYIPGEPGQTLKRRVQMFFGDLGDIWQLFLANPQAGTETYDREALHQGLMHAHLDGSGRLSVQSAAGVSLQRSDRIAIPKKVKEPWDPEGDQPENEDEDPAPKLPFAYSEEHPFARNLQLNDANGWLLGRAYRRFDVLTADWYTPEEEDLKVPDNEYDPLNAATENFDRYDGRKSGLFVEEDGSVVIRDAWGSEIYMRGGNIVMSSPGDIMKQPGGSDVTMAGKDVVLKAKNSVDVSATENDVRIKAHGNMHLFTKEKGILLETESTGQGTHGFDEEAEGETVGSSGINLKAPGSRVFIWGGTVHLSAAANMIIETIDRTAGRVMVLAGRVLGFASNWLLAGEEGTASIQLSRNSATVTGDSVALQGDKSVLISRDAQILQPLQWVDTADNPAQSTQAFTRSESDAATTDTFLGEFSAEEREKIKFTFRKADQYGTDKATETDPSAMKFQLYQVPWQRLAEAGHPLVPSSTDVWEEEKVNETYPWPGKVNFESPVYINITQESNTNEDGTTKNRIELSNEPGAFVGKSLNEYPVIRK